MITPGASHQAGHFQVVMAQKLSRLELIGLLLGPTPASIWTTPGLPQLTPARVTIQADPPADVEAEGENRRASPP